MTSKTKMKDRSYVFAFGVLVMIFAVFALFQVVNSYSGSAQVVVEGDYYEAPRVSGDEEFVAGGLVHIVQEIFVNGLKAGSNETLVINGSGEWVGPVAIASTADQFTFAGNVTVNGDLNAEDITASASVTVATTLGVTGIATFSEDLIVNSSSIFVIASVTGQINTDGDILGEDFTASGSMDIAGTTTLTGHFILVNASASGTVEFAGPVIASSSFTVAGTNTLTGAFILVNASASGNVEIAGSTQASGSFTVGGHFIGVTASISGTGLTVAGDGVFGSTTASGSGLTLELVSAATVTMGFESGDAVGTCLEMRDTAGTITYGRMNAGETALTFNTTSCK